MHKPDKATTERNAKILRELVRQPENKLCADCKRNDPRWASWNLGVYLCIRCSGIHRGMGTHISRVKSIDLDMWTPEQMESIQKWGNRRANLYWEAHLKAGHIPPDHKMESFIRSKYESRRWALDDPPPSDPSVLEESTVDDRPTHAPTASLSAPRPSSPSVHSPFAFRQNTASTHSQSRQLLSAAVVGRVQAPSLQSSPSPSQSQPQNGQQPQPQPPKPKPEDDLFSLDFHAPPPATAPQPPAKDVKQDILALFSTAPSVPSAAPSNAFGQFASAATATSASSSAWDALAGSAPEQQHPVSMMGATGTGFWGVSSGWNGTIPNANPGTNLWGTSGAGGLGLGGAPNTNANATTNANSLSMFNATDIWGAAGATNHTNGNGMLAAQATTTKKDDVFGDLWGDFK